MTAQYGHLNRYKLNVFIHSPQQTVAIRPGNLSVSVQSPAEVECKQELEPAQTRRRLLEEKTAVAWELPGQLEDATLMNVQVR